MPRLAGFKEHFWMTFLRTDFGVGLFMYLLLSLLNLS